MNTDLTYALGIESATNYASLAALTSSFSATGKEEKISYSYY